MKCRRLVAVSALAIVLCAAMCGCARKPTEEVSDLIGRLISGTPAEIENAAAALVEAGKTAVDPVLIVLGDEDPQHRVRAAEVFRRLGEQEVLGQADRRRISTRLIEIAPRSPEEVRVAVAQALGAYGDSPVVAGALVLMLKDESPRVADAASKSLVRIGRSAVPMLALIHEKPTIAHEDRLEARAVPQTQMESIEVALQEADADIRAGAVEMLMNYCDEHVVPLLVRAAADAESRVRLLAVQALAAYSGPVVDAALEGAMEDSEPPVVVMAAQVLAGRGSDRATRFLERMIQTGEHTFEAVEQQMSSAAVRADTALFLGYLRDLRRLSPVRVIDLLVELVNPEKMDQAVVRYEAARLLESVAVRGQHPRVMAALQAILERTDPRRQGEFLEKDARVLLTTARATGRAGSQKAAEILLKLASSEQQTIRMAAVFALGELGPQAVPYLLVDELVEPASSPVESRRAIALALGRIGTSDAVPFLVRMLEDPDVEVRLAAALSLGEIVDQRAVAPLVERLRSSDVRERWYVSRTLGRFSAGAEEELLRRLNDPELTAAALSVLEFVGGPKSLSALTKVLAAKDYSLRLGAAQALAGTLGRCWQEVDDQSAETVLHEIQAAARALSEQTGLTDEQIEQAARTRMALADALGSLRVLQARRALLWIAATDRDKRVRVASAVAYGRALGRATDVVDVLIEALGDEDSALRVAAVRGMAREGALTAAPALTRVADADPDAQVRAEARRAYRMITGLDYQTAGGS